MIPASEVNMKADRCPAETLRVDRVYRDRAPNSQHSKKQLYLPNDATLLAPEWSREARLACLRESY